LGLYFPWDCTGLYADLPCQAPKDAIFFFEALAACSAVFHAARTSVEPMDRIAVFSDNTNTVALFNTLRALPDYNEMVKSTVDILLEDNTQLRVVHILGKDNVIADALSRKKFDLVLELVPGIQLSPFTPPRDALGA
ncbi:hypothetical protein BKA93DRAFT_699110, partial [Sparassis latifolia]